MSEENMKFVREDRNAMKKLISFLLCITLAIAMPVIGFAEEQNSDIPVVQGVPHSFSGLCNDKRRPLYINGQWFYYQGFLLNDINYIFIDDLEKLFGITDLEPIKSKMVRGSQDLVSGPVIGVPLEVLAQYYPNIQYYFEPITQSILMTIDGSNPQNIPEDLQERIDTLPQQEQAIKEVKKNSIAPILIMSPLDVCNSEPRPIYKGSYNRQLTSAMNWAWDETYSFWIKNMGNFYTYYAISSEETQFIISENREEDFFKYYKLYQIPYCDLTKSTQYYYNSGKPYKLTIVDSNGNPINVSDYLGDYQLPDFK